MNRISPSRPREFSLRGVGNPSGAGPEPASGANAVRLDKSGRYEIPVVRRTRVQARQQRRREAGIVLLVVAAMGAATAGVAWWHDRDGAGPVPVVRLDQPLPPAGGFAVPADRMSQTLATVLPARVGEDVSLSTVSGDTLVESAPGDGAPLIVQVGRVLVDDGTSASEVRVEVSATPSVAPCAAPCTISGDTWTRAYRPGDVLVTVRLSEDGDGTGLDEAGRTAIAIDPVWLH